MMIKVPENVSPELPAGFENEVMGSWRPGGKTTVFRNVKLTGKFGPNGLIAFHKEFSFDFAIVKADCEVVISGQLQRFVAEEVLDDPEQAKIREMFNSAKTDAEKAAAIEAIQDADPPKTRLRPDAGFAPMLCARTDTVQLQGRPNDTWELTVHVALVDVVEEEARRKARYESEGKLDSFKPRPCVTSPKTDGDIIDCTEFVAEMGNGLRQ